MIQLQTNKHTCAIQSDRGGEFLSTNFTKLCEEAGNSKLRELSLIENIPNVDNIPNFPNQHSLNSSRSVAFFP